MIKILMSAESWPPPKPAPSSLGLYAVGRCLVRLYRLTYVFFHMLNRSLTPYHGMSSKIGLCQI